jgi:hypothetical protein
MGRQPDGNYIIPDGTYGAPDQTVYSARYNGWVNDVAATFNLVQPVNKGGTGADNAEAALVNLSGEKATQLVTNYNSHLFYPGSFRSANTAGIPGAPVDSHAFAGACYLNEPLVYPPTNQNLIIEARDESDTTIPGRTYVREKKAGTWGPWTGGIFAAPFDAMAYSGMQINGDFNISQQLGLGGTNINNAYFADQWRMSAAGATMFAGSRSPLFPGIASAGLYSAQTSKPTLSADDLFSFQQRIEGYRILRLMWGTALAMPVTIAFWSQHNASGTYSVSVRNFDGSRSYVTSYTQSASNTAEYKVVTIPGCVDGVWKANNEIGILLDFCFGSGSTYTATTANVWVNGNKTAAPGQVNAMAVTDNFGHISGVTVLPGTQAPTAAQSPLIMRPYDQELATCQRYYYKLIGGLQTHAVSGTYYSVHWLHPVMMRVAPTMTRIADLTLVNFSPPISEYSGADGVRLTAQATGNGQAGFSTQFHADARL